MWKVPLRQVYCASFSDCLKQTFWCHFVLRVFPYAHDFGSDACVRYLQDPSAMSEQLGFIVREALDARLKRKRSHLRVVGKP